MESLEVSLNEDFEIKKNGEPAEFISFILTLILIIY
jgi:hypothetical protein